MSKYKIGQLSKTMGVSTHLLKHYEKFNLVMPVKDDTTQYRYYDIAQCSNIIEAKKLRNMGFAIKDTSRLINDCDTKELKSSLIAQIEEISNQQRILEQQRKNAVSYLEDMSKMQENLGEWYVESLPGFVFLKQTDNKDMLEDGKTCWENYDFLADLPVAKSAVWIMQDSFHGSMKYHWGIVSEGQHDLPSVKQEIFLTLKEGKYYVSYLSVPSPYMENGVLIDAILDNLKNFTKAIPEYVLCIRYYFSHENGTEQHYFKIIVPI